jgi:hypothetical protein
MFTRTVVGHWAWVRIPPMEIFFSKKQIGIHILEPRRLKQKTKQADDKIQCLCELNCSSQSFLPPANTIMKKTDPKPTLNHFSSYLIYHLCDSQNFKISSKV